MKPLYQLSVYAFFAGLSVNVLAHNGPLDHAGFHNSLAAGFMHPLTGVDHLLAMLMAGALLVNSARRQMIVYAIAMLLALLTGTGMGAFFGASQAIEWLVMGSCFIIVGAMMAKYHYAMTEKSACIFLCSLFMAHGWAHGAELPHENITLFISGFLLAALMLFAVGVLVMQGIYKVVNKISVEITG